MRKRVLLPALFIAVVAAGIGLYTGHKLSERRAAIRGALRAEAPDGDEGTRVTWQPPTKQKFQKKESVDPPVKQTQPKETDTPSLAPQVAIELSTPSAPFALDMTKPTYISWPLDIGPDLHSHGKGKTLCLRARQGVNELQKPGSGKAYYPFRLKEDGLYSSWFRVRWVNDGIGSVDCNNSWFAAFDNHPTTRIGLEQITTRWFWQRGPTVKLKAGTHWLRVELREDGVRMDRVVIASGKDRQHSSLLDTIKPHTFCGFAGDRLPLMESRRIGNVTSAALPTRSLVIGNGHVNEITVLASCQGRKAFTGTIDVTCHTARGVVVGGDRDIKCTPESPFVRNILTLSFPEQTARRFHLVNILIRDSDERIVSRSTLRFVKPYVWAFLGPFQDLSGRRRQVYRYTGTIDRVIQPCDRDPLALARRQSLRDLGLQDLAGAGKDKKISWRVVSDGSCCDWTGAVDLRKVYDTRGPAFAYAVTWIQAQTRLHHRSFVFQSDDSAWLWINGHQAVRLTMDLPREAHRLWTSAPLNPGRNPVVIKLTQNQRYWGFRFDVVDWHWQGRRGDVIRGLEVEKW